MGKLGSTENKKNPTEPQQSWMRRLLSWQMSNMSEPSPLRRNPAGFSIFILLQMIAYGILNLFRRASRPWLFGLLFGLCAGIAFLILSH